MPESDAPACLIAAGGTLGAIAGSSLAGLVAGLAGPIPLLLLAVAFLELTIVAARRLTSAGIAPQLRNVESIQPSTSFNTGTEESSVVMAKVAMSGAGRDALSADPSSAARQGPNRRRSDKITKSIRALSMYPVQLHQ